MVPTQISCRLFSPTRFFFWRVFSGLCLTVVVVKTVAQLCLLSYALYDCRIEKLNFSFDVKHKKPEPPDFPNGRLFTVSSEDEWQIYQDSLFGEDGKEYELVGKFSVI